MDKYVQIIMEDEIPQNSIRVKAPNRKSKESSKKKSMKSERAYFK